MRRIRWTLGLVKLARTLTPGAIVAEATQPHRMTVLATSEEAGRRAMEAVAGDRAQELEQRGDLPLVVLPAARPAPRSTEVIVWAIDRSPEQVGRADELTRWLANAVTGVRAVVVVFRSRDGLMGWDSLMTSLGHRVRIEFLPTVSTDPGELRADLIPLVLRLVPELRLALARHFPPFRQVVARQIVLETSAGNARFAAVSNLPTLIPVIGNFLAAGADLYVLTRNQVQMVFILAAISGRNLRGGVKLLLEVSPLVGTGFFWRTVARELVDFLPFYLGAVPKILIAYVGTFVLGESVSFYLLQGRRPDRATIHKFYKNALLLAKGQRPRAQGPG